MNKINLLIITFALSLSCKTKNDPNTGNHLPIDINSAIQHEHADSITYYEHLQIDSIVNSLIRNDTIGMALGKSSENAPYLITVRTKTGFVEIHEQMDDIAIIRSGHGSLKTGRQVSGITRTSGEKPFRNWFCDTIQGATERKLSPGDFIIIPAMTAHQYLPNADDTLTYWTIKVKNSKKVN